MEPSEIYAACRTRLLTLATTLSPSDLDAALAATPPWVVLDGYRHLAGVCSDMLDGVLDGAGSPPWTAAQLAARRGRTVGEVCAEWGGRGPDLDARIAEAGLRMAFAPFDAWTHEQDIRAAAGVPTIRDDEVAAAVADLALSTFAGRYGSTGAPTVRVVIGEKTHVLGEGEPDVVLSTTSFEIMRIIFGRRSRAQVEAADWSAHHAAVFDAIHLFDFPDADIAD